ncbi:MAG: Efflux transporter, RND family, MFP subunit [Candidatus Moranbacteria bacterium GW2011_GWE2_47_10]|nr:MAG: Efflux transporter, RND family, MFP subunit [Candidatus Moranbacteria bacterium GW2011_GWE2_47_10]HBP01242.1 hypothetical protein [Candidatus Moranbacteria bacterium]
MSKSKKRIIWVIAVLAVVIGGYLIFGGKDKEAVYTTADAEKGSLSQTVSSTGDLTDEREITLNFEIGGRIGRIFVKEGQMVAAGDPIATIDNPVLSSQVSQAKAGFDLAVAQAGGTDDSIREAEVVVKNTEEVLSDTEDLNDKNISAAKKAEDDAKDYLDDAQDYYDAVVASGASSVEIKSAALTLSTAERNHNAAQKAVDVAERQAELSETNAENAVKVAKARLKTLESEFTKNSNDASVSSARASYDIALENLGKATLKSSVNGTITRINNKVGEILGTGVIKESFTKVITNDFIIESNISESDIVKVSLGDKAEVTFDALNPDDIFEGEVVQIDTDATVIQDVVYYRLKLKINNVDQRLKPGMSANIDIMTAEKGDVVKVPLRAIKLEGNRKYVEILKENNEVEKIFVQTGLEGDEGIVEITSGLKGGEKVVTFVQEN